MKITAIKQQERLKGRYSIYVDEKYAFSLSADALLDSKLHQRQEIDEQQLKSFKKLSADDKAYGLSLMYAARRLRSRYEFTDYLRRKGYDAELSGQIMEKLGKLGLIDDEKFARAWINDRRLLKPVSRRRLAQELRQKRIESDTIDRVLAEDTADELDVLRELVARRRRQTKYQDDMKLMQYLARQGFGYDDIKTALNEEKV
jgi:regulatory protein